MASNNEPKSSTPTEKRERARHNIDRKTHAERILGDPLIEEAFGTMRNTIIEGWRNTAGHEHEQRHNAYLMLRLLDHFRNHFEEIIRTGQFSERDLEEAMKEGNEDKDQQQSSKSH